MAAVAQGWFRSQFVPTPICYVNRSLLATAVAQSRTVMNYPGFCNGPLFVNPSFHLRHPFAGILLLSGVGATTAT